MAYKYINIEKIFTLIYNGKKFKKGVNDFNNKKFF